MKAGENKIQKYNEQIQDFFQRQVLEWVSPEELAGEGNQQVSYIPLTYAEKSEGTTKMRICSNSSFSTGGKCSLNQCMLPGPNVMTSLLSCLLAFRSNYQIAIADISKMFHALATGKKTNNLRRVWIKRGGMGSDSEI